MIIGKVENPVIDDFYTLSGAGIPADAVIQFTTASGIVNVNTDFIRPHLALVERLPASIPPGAATVRITSPSTSSSNTLSVVVADHAPEAVRILHAGEDKPEPYTIVFVANPGIQSVNETNFSADPVLSDRHAFQAMVTHCFHGLFLLDEDVLREDDNDARMRLVSVFDPTRPATNANSLAHRLLDNVMEPRRDILADFLSSFDLAADIVVVIHGSPTHRRASAWPTTDDEVRAGTPYVFDDDDRRHGHFARIPGSMAIPAFPSTTNTNQIRTTILHEFGHAASDINNGKVIDLFNDAGRLDGFIINKKFRAMPSDPVPAHFANYEDTNFDADPNRDGLGYRINWRSFHPELIDTTRPNLMDNFKQAPDGAPHRCRLDQLTSEWFRDRLAAKLSR